MYVIEIFERESYPLKPLPIISLVFVMIMKACSSISFSTFFCLFPSIRDLIIAL
jgi:hypothetical protein